MTHKVEEPIIHVSGEPEMTSFDARQLLLELRESSHIPDDIVNAGRVNAIYEAILRLAYDADARHLIRAIAAKGFIPYYGHQYTKMYIQVFGFERQGLLVAQVDRDMLAEAMVSNMYAAADHIYWALSSMCDDVLKLIREDNYETLITIHSVLHKLNATASRILAVEKSILNDRQVMQDWKVQEIFGDGMTFVGEVPDRAYRNNPHWKNFHEHFEEQCQRLGYAINQIGYKPYSKYRRLDLLVSKLEDCAIKRK